MRDTPRTDTVLVAWDLAPEPKVLIEHARELERELNAANSIIRQQQLLDEENFGLRQRIKRLEDRIQKLESLASLGGPSVKFYPLDPPFGTAAKEAKP